MQGYIFTYRQQKDRTYVMTADVSRGTKNDYSAFCVIDVTELPYKIVAKYRDNEVKPLLFPQKIYEVARAYNQAFVLIEVNDIGEQVASVLCSLIWSMTTLLWTMRGRAGQVLGGGFSGGKSTIGSKNHKGS